MRSASECAGVSSPARLGPADRRDLVALVLPGHDLPVLDAPHAAAHRRLLSRFIHHHVAEGQPLPALDFWTGPELGGEGAVIIGTAGHVDHGKSALVEALTGPPDGPAGRGAAARHHHRSQLRALCRSRMARWRGFIDVPGHEDFVQTMVAGASGIDLVLLVVAADEGIMPQTREHLAIVEQLGIPRGIAVITKADLAEPEWLELLTARSVRGSRVPPWHSRSRLPSAPSSGEGLSALRAATAAQAARSRPRDPPDLFRMPVDRAFSVRGSRAPSLPAPHGRAA